MDKVVTIKRTYVGDTLKGYKEGIRKADVTLKVGNGSTWSSSNYTVLTGINPVQAATMPEDVIWSTFFEETEEPEPTIYLMVPEGATHYRLEVDCPDCGETIYVQGTF